MADQAGHPGAEELQLRLHELHRVLSLEGRLKGEIDAQNMLEHCAKIGSAPGGVGELARKQQHALRDLKALAAAASAYELLCAHLEHPFALGSAAAAAQPHEMELVPGVPADVAPTILSYAGQPELWRARHVSRTWYAAVRAHAAERLGAALPSGVRPSMYAEFKARAAAAAAPDARESLSAVLQELVHSTRQLRQQLVPHILQLREKRLAAQSLGFRDDWLRRDLIRQNLEAESGLRKLRARESAARERAQAALRSCGVEPSHCCSPLAGSRSIGLLRLARRVLAQRLASAGGGELGDGQPEWAELPQSVGGAPPSPRSRPPLPALPAAADHGATAPPPEARPAPSIGSLLDGVASLESRFARSLAHALITALPPGERERAPPDAATPRNTRGRRLPPLQLQHPAGQPDVTSEAEAALAVHADRHWRQGALLGGGVRNAQLAALQPLPPARGHPAAPRDSPRNRLPLPPQPPAAPRRHAPARSD